MLGRVRRIKLHIRAESYVYFMLNPKTALIKIGYSAAPDERKSDLNLQYRTKLEILGVFPGTMHEEHLMHMRFSQYHSHHEWFHDAPPIREAVKGCISETEYLIADALHYIDEAFEGMSSDPEIEAFRLYQKRRLVSKLSDGKVTFEDWAHAYRPKDLSAQEGEGK